MAVKGAGTIRIRGAVKGFSPHAVGLAGKVRVRGAAAGVAHPTIIGAGEGRVRVKGAAAGRGYQPGVFSTGSSTIAYSEDWI